MNTGLRTGASLTQMESLEMTGPSRLGVEPNAAPPIRSDNWPVGACGRACAVPSTPSITPKQNTRGAEPRVLILAKASGA